MSSLDICSTDELNNRLKYLMGKIDSKLKDVGPVIEEIARMRKECEIIQKELSNRTDIG